MTMTTTMRALGTLLLMALGSGCPLTEDPQAKDDPEMSGQPADGDGSDSADGSRGDGAPSDGSDGTPADGTPADGTPADGTPADGTDGSPADGADGTPADGDTGDGDVGLDAGSELDAGETLPDAGTGVVDAGHSEPDAGPAVVVPDLGAVDLPDQDRANLIRDLMATENYVEAWLPFFESTTALRDLTVTPSHGNKVRVFANGVARRAADQWIAGGLALPAVFPHGSVVAKQVFRLDATTQEYVYSQTVVMAKVSGLDPVNYEGGWFFVRINATDEASRSTTCVNCHNGRKATAIWPIDPNIPGDMGGREGGIVPYDYLFGPFCYDPLTPQCSPHE